MILYPKGAFFVSSLKHLYVVILNKKKSCFCAALFKMGSIDKALPSRGKLTRIAKSEPLTQQR
jgi:hypothetical protein